MESWLHEQSTLSVRDQLVYGWWNLTVTIKHWFGIHTMIPEEEIDFIEEVVQLKGMICWRCNHRE